MTDTAQRTSAIKRALYMGLSLSRALATRAAAWWQTTAGPTVGRGALAAVTATAFLLPITIDVATGHQWIVSQREMLRFPTGILTAAALPTAARYDVLLTAMVEVGDRLRGQMLNAAVELAVARVILAVLELDVWRRRRRLAGAPDRGIPRSATSGLIVNVGGKWRCSVAAL